MSRAHFNEAEASRSLRVFLGLIEISKLLLLEAEKYAEVYLGSSFGSPWLFVSVNTWCMFCIRSD